MAWNLTEEGSGHDKWVLAFRRAMGGDQAASATPRGKPAVRGRPANQPRHLVADFVKYKVDPDTASRRIDCVVGPVTRNHIAREQYLTLGTAAGRDRLMRAAACGYRLEQKLSAAEGKTYLVFWAQNKLRLRLSLVAQETGKISWTASNELRRSEGGIPLFLIGTPVFVYEAMVFNWDSEQVYSMIDDAIRRLWETFPSWVVK